MKDNFKISNSVDNELDTWGTVFSKDKEISFAEINSKIENSGTATIIPIKKFKWSRIAVAASISLLIGLGLFFNNTNEVDYKTAAGESTEISLPDGSSVVLNAMSSIAFNESDWDENRTVRLSGEAYFEVKKGSDFTVQSEHGLVSVLGTGFNIYDRNDTYEVGCTHGKVSVSHKNRDVILTEGLHTELLSGILTEPVVTNYISDWTSGKFYFDEAPLSRVIDELKNQFNVAVESNIDVARTFTGSFESSDLDEALQVICEPMGIAYSKENNTIVLNSK